MSVSIREIARQMGLSIATVSLALRGTGKISRQTRDKVQATAKALGYQPHPLFSRAFSLARQPEDQRYRETLALIIEWEPGTGSLYQKNIHAGAEEQARGMGYKLEPFIVSGKPADQRRVARILQARGIRGVIVIPRVGTPQPRLGLDWQHFAPVEICRTLWHPRNLHHVDTAGYPVIMEALHLLKRVGYRRIGMAVEPAQNLHQNGVYYAAYLFSQLRLPVRRRIPILASTGPWNEKTFRAWMERHEPDVLFIHWGVAEMIKRWLAKMNFRVPGDVSLFYANIFEDDELSGLRRDYYGMGKAAVEMAARLSENGELGLSDHPRDWHIDERWQPGKTLSRSISAYITEDGVLRQRLPRGLQRS